MSASETSNLVAELRAQIERLSIGSKGNVWEEVRALRSALERIRDFRCSAFRTYQQDRDDMQAIARAALSKQYSANETAGDATAAALKTALTAIDEAYDLLTCARPAEHLESATPEEWYEQRSGWYGRNRFSVEPSDAARQLGDLDKALAFRDEMRQPKATDERRPTGQCSWGCYYSDDGRLVRDSACTVHGASSENGT